MKGDTMGLRILLVVAVAIIGTLSYGLLPFEAAGGLDCDASLRGADPKETATEGFLVNREEQACSDRSGSRITVMGIVALLYMMVGVGAVVLPESGIERVVFGGVDPEEVFPGD